MKEIGKLWHALSPEEKAVFEQKAREDKDRYQGQMFENPERDEPIPLSSCVTGTGRFKQSKNTVNGFSPLTNQPKKKLSPYMFFVKVKR